MTKKRVFPTVKHRFRVAKATLIALLLLLGILLATAERSGHATTTAAASSGSLAATKTIPFTYHTLQLSNTNVLSGPRTVVHDGGSNPGYVYVVQEHARNVVKVNAGNMTVQAVLPLASCTNVARQKVPTPVSAVLDGDNLYVTAEAGGGDPGGIFRVKVSQSPMTCTLFTVTNQYHLVGIALRPTGNGTKIVAVHLGPDVSSVPPDRGCCGQLLTVTPDKNNTVSVTTLLDESTFSSWTYGQGSGPNPITSVLQVPIGLHFQDANTAFLVTHPPGNASRPLLATQTLGITRTHALTTALNKATGNSKDNALISTIRAQLGHIVTPVPTITEIAKDRNKWKLLDNGRAAWTAEVRGGNVYVFGNERRGRLLRLHFNTKQVDIIATGVFGGTSIATATLNGRRWVLLPEFGTEGSYADGLIRIIDPDRSASWFEVTPFSGAHDLAFSSKHGFVVEVDGGDLCLSTFVLSELASAMKTLTPSASGGGN
jgi:hypothetical protein